MSIQQIIESPKTTVGLAAATTGTWFNDFLNWIPDDITKLAAVAGIIAVTILCRVHWLNSKKLEIEIALLKREEQEKEKKRQIRRNKRTSG